MLPPWAADVSVESKVAKYTEWVIIDFDNGSGRSIAE